MQHSTHKNLSAPVDGPDSRSYLLVAVVIPPRVQRNPGHTAPLKHSARRTPSCWNKLRASARLTCRTDPGRRTTGVLLFGESATTPSKEKDSPFREWTAFEMRLYYSRSKFLLPAQIDEGQQTICTPQGLSTPAQGRDAGAHPGKAGRSTPTLKGLSTRSARLARFGVEPFQGSFSRGPLTQGALLRRDPGL